MTGTTSCHRQVKGDNQEMGTLERRIHELKAEINKATEDLDIAENVSFYMKWH